MSELPVVVIGAGQAGMQICDSVRKAGYAGSLILIGEEASLPYQRPPLSKKFLTGTVDPERLLFRPADFYAKIDVELRLGERVSAIDRQQRTLTLAGDETLSYAKLALATGSRVRRLSCPGADLDGVLYVRTLEDGKSLHDRLIQSKRIAVVGGGFIGLEVAAIARELGKSVILIETMDRLMVRALPPLLSEFYAALHRERGVDLVLGQGVREIRRENNLLLLETNDGVAYQADTVVVGIGVVPNVELAEQSGLECRNGIVVDARGATNDPDVVAAGDCTMHANGFLGREIRLESVQNAVDQAKIAAANLCGQAKTYDRVPWFWSDQYDVKLQMAGIGTPHDEHAVRGEIGPQGFSIFYFRDGALIAADSVNRPADHMACRKLLMKGIAIEPDQVRDLNFDLKQATQA